MRALTSDGEVKPVLVPYLRVSTDDKGQDPQRQMARIAPWADLEGFILLKPEREEKSASKYGAFEREGFVRACERAKAAGAAGIIVEAPDRFSRQDPLVAVWELVEVRRRYGLEIFFASDSLESQKTTMGKLIIFFKLGISYDWVTEHTLKVMTGMAPKLGKGVFGRKPKKLSPQELDLVKELRGATGDTGWETIAVRINELRGVHRLTDRKAAKEKGVSSGSLRRMAREGVFGQDEMRRASTPDEIISSGRGQDPESEGVVSSGGPA